MRKFKFVGFGEKETYFGEGEFSVGNIYEALKVNSYSGLELEPHALFVDDEGFEMYEELHGFEEVTDNDTE